MDRSARQSEEVGAREGQTRRTSPRSGAGGTEQSSRFCLCRQRQYARLRRQSAGVGIVGSWSFDLFAQRNSAAADAMKFPTCNGEMLGLSGPPDCPKCATGGGLVPRLVSLLSSLDAAIPEGEGTISLRLFSDASGRLDLEMWGAPVASGSLGEEIVVVRGLVIGANPDWLPDVEALVASLNSILANDERMHLYQRGRTSITGWRWKYGKSSKQSGW